GCFKGEQSMEETDPPPENLAEDNESMDEGTMDEDGETEVDGETEGDEDNSNDAQQEKVERELYLIDADGMVASQTLDLPKSKEVATQAMEYLVKEGPVTPILPNGFEAVLPAETEILGLNLKEDGTMIVDVSTEFKNYEPEDELKILQAMT